MDERVLIWSCEHTAWWRAHSHGYTRELPLAGRYTQAAAAGILARANLVRVNECTIPESCVALDVLHLLRAIDVAGFDNPVLVQDDGGPVVSMTFPRSQADAWAALTPQEQLSVARLVRLIAAAKRGGT